MKLPSPAQNFRLAAALAVTAMSTFSSPARAGTIAIQNGQKLAFMGDSITQQGWGHPAGYVKLVVAGLDANGVKVEPIPAGISGHKSNQMLARLDKDVLSKKPNWMTLSCGVNDVWHGAKGVPLDEYKKNITEIIDKSHAAGVKVMILTSTMIKEDAANAENQKLAEYNDFLRAVAKEKKLLLADLNADMQAALKKIDKPEKPGKALTVDGVHMNPAGDKMMATGILKAFGLDDAQLAKAHAEWEKVAVKPVEAKK